MSRMAILVYGVICELFGLRQVHLHARGLAQPLPAFKTPALYR